MPYIIKTRALKGLFATAATALLTGAAPAIASATECQAQSFSQPFAFVNDSSSYVLVPGESPDAFEGEAGSSAAARVSWKTPLMARQRSGARTPGRLESGQPDVLRDDRIPDGPRRRAWDEGPAPPTPTWRLLRRNADLEETPEHRATCT